MLQVLKPGVSCTSSVAYDHPERLTRISVIAPKEPIALHEILLAGWGCPIGELFDLERLATHCEKQRRWTFFLASMPLNNPGGAASPPNAVAIF